MVVSCFLGTFFHLPVFCFVSKASSRVESNAPWKGLIFIELSDVVTFVDQTDIYAIKVVNSTRRQTISDYQQGSNIKVYRFNQNKPSG